MIRSANGPGNGLKYEVSLTSTVFCFDSKTLTTMKELIKKVGITEIHESMAIKALLLVRRASWWRREHLCSWPPGQIW